MPAGWLNTAPFICLIIAVCAIAACLLAAILSPLLVLCAAPFAVYYVRHPFLQLYKGHDLGLQHNCLSTSILIYRLAGCIWAGHAHN